MLRSMTLTSSPLLRAAHKSALRASLPLQLSASAGATRAFTDGGAEIKPPGSLERLFENNKKWRDGKKLLDPDYFDKTAMGQHPQYLWIGCSDSRVPAEEITGLAPGEMFVHRNVANLVVANDVSCLSVVQYAVEHLKVKDIIICGHYGCGGVRAAMDNQSLGLLDNWLRNIRDVCRIHHDELQEIEGSEDRLNRMIELNTIEQCINMFKIGLVQRHQVKYGFPRIHGLVYNLQDGELKELDVDFKSYIKKYNSIYKLHSFESETPLRRSQLQSNMIRTLTEGHDEETGRVSVKYLKRAMQHEPLLFSETETDSAIAFVQEGETDKTTVSVEKLVRYYRE
ncbi:Carbonic anhydrase [Globisporangium polare]